MNADWLAQLSPDRAPARVGWWPPALGWWLAALALIVLAMLAVSALRWWQAPRRRLRRAALRELRRIRTHESEAVAAAQAIEQLLRRYAIALFGRERIARLSGSTWLEFARGVGGEGLGGDTGRSLLAAAFGERASADPALWFRAAEDFIRRAARARATG